jgi:hypothetical protein
VEQIMLRDTGWASYLSARRAALSCRADPDLAGSIVRAERRLTTYLGLTPEDALLQARRCALFAADAAFHDQLLTSGCIDVLRTLVARTAADPHVRTRSHGTLVVSLHYGPATSIVPLCLADAGRRGHSTFAVVQNSRSNRAVVLPPARQAALAAAGFPILDLDIARLGEIGVLRRALAVLGAGGTVLIFADGQLPRPDVRRTVACRLGGGHIALPRGAEWLARSAGVPLLPLIVRAERDVHRLVSLPEVPPQAASAAYQALINAAVDVDPAPWSRWCCGADHF